MKKLTFLLVIVLAFSTVATFAQTEQGKWFLQGSSNLYFEFGKEKYKHNGDSQDQEKYFTFNFTPMAGYTVIDNLPVGLFIDFTNYKYTNPDDKDDFYRSTEYLIGPFVRYYILDLNGFKPHVEAAVGIGSHSDAWGPEDDDKDSGGLFEYWLGVGGTYFLNNHVGIDLGIGYGSESYKYKGEGDGDEDYKDVYGGVYFNLGVVVTLGE
ncbi:MAG: hypothetical protein PHD61_06155 [Bacteroidales bacterium]|nr:hypothetical protein [Bacteroidales bacterium]